jgi:hypothetical protein
MKWLRKLFGEPSKPLKELIHPFFGRCVFDEGKDGLSGWEAESEVEGRTISVLIDGDETGPTEQQVAFYRNVVGDLNGLFRRIADVIGPEYEAWVRAPLPSNWRQAFAFSSVSIPPGGSDTEDWEISYDCLTDRDGHMFFVRFEQGRPVSVTIDG